MKLSRRIDALPATDFQKRVWHALCAVPAGTVITYAGLAARIGYPRAVRAVATAVGKNPLAPNVPCHRVVRSDGHLGGYSASGGVRAKYRLLRSEGVALRMIGNGKKGATTSRFRFAGVAVLGNPRKIDRKRRS